MKIILITGMVLVGLLLFTCRGGAQHPDDSYKVLTPAEFAEKRTENPALPLVDVRTPEEYEEGHIEGASNVDVLNPPVFEAQFQKFDKEEPVMLYCRSGKRSRRAANKLREMGFTHIYDLQGGYLNWQKTNDK